MKLQINAALNILYDMADDAPMSCTPQSVNTSYTSFYLKTKINFSLASHRTLEVPTGIILTSFPKFAINEFSSSLFNVALVGTCSSYEDILVDCGVKVLGPQIVTEEYDRELSVILQNESDQIFNAEVGDEIAILSFDIKPIINLELNVNNLNPTKALI